MANAKPVHAPAEVEAAKEVEVVEVPKEEPPVVGIRTLPDGTVRQDN